MAKLPPPQCYPHFLPFTFPRLQACWSSCLQEEGLGVSWVEWWGRRGDSGRWASGLSAGRGCWSCRQCLLPCREDQEGLWPGLLGPSPGISHYRNKVGWRVLLRGPKTRVSISRPDVHALSTCASPQVHLSNWETCDSAHTWAWGFFGPRLLGGGS